MIATSSQRAAFETLLAMGNLYFSGRRTLPKIKLRLQPLIIGATGCGKSFLVENAARRLQAKYFRITRGDWIPYGSKGPRPTVFRILDEVATFDRVVLHIDELDKFGNLQEREWSAAIASDIWNILDGRFQLGEYLHETMFPDGKKPNEQALAHRVRTSLWIVGSGTWQDVYSNSRGRPTMGFQCGRQPVESVDMAKIAGSEMISPELLHRFGEPIFIEYPTREETAQLIESTGIASLAAQAGILVSADQINWNQGGLRVLETLATRLTVALYRSKQPGPTSLPLDRGAEPEAEKSPF